MRRFEISLFLESSCVSEISCVIEISCIFELNPQAPVAQKIADEVAFRRFQSEGVEFFEIGPH